ncbi:phenylacetate--CoA ligase [Clostridia bacterium]|nr:phenylacetate--CoA ligase [Clostridia bacterium]
MIWNKKYETMDREELEALQLARLKSTVQHVYDHVPFYKNKLDEIGFLPGDVKSLADVRNLPMTYKADLRDNYPFGLFAVPKKELVRVHASSGTTGKPTVVGYTAQDLETWSELTARVLSAGGVTAESTVQVAFGYGLFTGAFGMHYGLEKIGATVVPTSSGNTEKQIMLMHDFEATGLICTPSYALYMLEVAEKMGIDPREDLKLKWGLFGSEGWTDAMRVEIEKRWNVEATDNYGMSELIGPGVSGECMQKNGMHINEDHFIAEVIDPDTGEVLPDGEVGELVFTAITKQALPLLRYRTMDLATITKEPCACGRTTARMSKVRGRTDDMLIIRGVNVFPSQIESVIVSTKGVAPQYQLVVTTQGYMDALEVQVEMVEHAFSDDYKVLEDIECDLAHRLKTILGIKAKVKLLEPRSLERFVGKAKRIVDKRDRK